MQKLGAKKVVAVVSDLFFSVKLTEAAKRSGLALEFVKEGNLVLEKASEKPSLIIFDLNFEAVEPLKLITSLKAKPETKSISLIGYLSHIQAELKQQAQEAGCDMVMARSAFSQNLPQIFKRHSGIG
ncbi:MAG TPA: response regulator [Bryobacteraceae bacterium]|jgi:PleD family two-component response regulator|nr:response regulator [Bryobacteraceae bacterium]